MPKFHRNTTLDEIMSHLTAMLVFAEMQSMAPNSRRRPTRFLPIGCGDDALHAATGALMDEGLTGLLTQLNDAVQSGVTNIEWFKEGRMNMKIIRLKTNRVVNPLGFSLGTPRLSFVVTETEAKKQAAARYEVALDDTFSKSVYDSGKREDIDSLAFELSINLKPRTRYFWRVKVWADNGEHAVSETAWFETAKMNEPWTAKWIVPEMDKDVHPVLGRTFELAGKSYRRAPMCAAWDFTKCRSMA